MASKLAAVTVSSCKFDELYVNEALKEFEDFFLYLKSIDPSTISNRIRSRLFVIYEMCGYFLSYLNVYNKDTVCKPKTDDSFWDDNFLFKYLFEDCITSSFNDVAGCVELFCLVCETAVNHSSASLMKHLNGYAHLFRYKEFRAKMEDIWKDIDFYKWAFEKFIDLRYDNTLYCRLCCVSITCTQVNLMNHLNGNKHMNKFINIVGIKCSIEKKISGYPRGSSEEKAKPEELIFDCKPNRKVVTKNKMGKSSKKETNKKVALKNEAVDKSPVSKHNKRKSVTRFAYYDPYSESLDEPKKHFKMSNDSNTGMSTPSKCNSTTSDISGCDSRKEERKSKRKTDPKKKLEIEPFITPEKGSNISLFSDKKKPDKSKPDSDKKNLKKFKINVKDIESHGFFMNKVLINKKPSVIKFHCQPCGYSEVLSSDDAVKNHITSLKHLQYTELKTNLAFMNYKSYYCQFCNVKFFCSEDLISYHDESKQHNQMCLNSARSNEFTQNVTESTPSSLSGSKIVNAKNIQKDMFNSDVEFLQTEMKMLLKSVLKMPIKKVTNDNYGSFCRGCSYWTKNVNKWSAHINSDIHHQNMSFEPNYKTFNCDCSIVLVCDDDFYSKHISSYEHKNLRSFVLQKSCAKKLTGLKRLDLKENVDPKNESINSNPSQINQGGIQPAQPKKLHEAFFCFQLSGLPADLKEVDIYKSFSNYGEIECVDFFEPNCADVFICLRNDLSVGYVEGFAKRGLIVQIKGTSCEIKEKRKCELSEEIVVRFSNNRHVLFEKLLSDSIKESLSPIITQRGEFLLKPDAVMEDVVKVCEQVKTARIIGSRATALAQSDSMLDVFIEMNGSLVFEIESCDSEVLEKLDEIARSLKDVKPPLFANIKVEGYCIVAEHNSTGLMCKFILNNGLAIENTEVIRLYAKADKRIKQLVLIIKEWVKFTDFPKFISNYALTWMVLYYLMQPDVNLINPVIVLKDDRTEERRKISGWDCSIRKVVQAADLLKPDPKLTSMDSLVIGFFQFYGSDIDIACVHCPLSGEVITKKKFSESEIPKLKIMNKTPFNMTKGLCLQDPFELNKNLTEKMQGSTLYKLKELSQQMITVLSNKTIEDDVSLNHD